MRCNILSVTQLRNCSGLPYTHRAAVQRILHGHRTALSLAITVSAEMIRCCRLRSQSCKLFTAVVNVADEMKLAIPDALQ